MKTFIVSAAIASFLAMNNNVSTANAASSYTSATTTSLRGKGAATTTTVPKSSLFPFTTEGEDEEENTTLRQLNNKNRKLSSSSTLETSVEYSKLLVTNLSSEIPVVGSFVYTGISILWGTTGSSWWTDLKDYLEDLIDALEFDNMVSDIKFYIDETRGHLEDSLKCEWDGEDCDCGDSKVADLELAANAAHKAYKYIRLAVSKDGDYSWDISADEEMWAENLLTIEYAITFAPLHLAILKELYLYGAFYYPQEYGITGIGETETATYKADLESYASIYQTYFDWMGENFWTERLKHIDYDYCETCSSGCNGKWWIKDELELFDKEVHKKVCNKNVGFLTGCPLNKVGNCLYKKLYSGLDELMPELEEAFLETISSMSTLEEDATNYPPIIDGSYCNPIQIHTRNSVDDDWNCVDKDACLRDDVDGNCVEGETCIVNDDCESDLRCDSDTNYCVPLSDENEYCAETDDCVLGLLCVTDNNYCFDFTSNIIDANDIACSIFGC